MRASGWFLVAAIAGCHPSATVERTTPVASLQSYHSIGLRVRSTAFAAQGLAYYLETAVLANLQKSCGFEHVGKADQGPSEVVLDLNITQAGRGGTGWITNNDQATINTLLVLSDGQSGELLGTARIRGKSSGAIINNSVPEQEAVDVVAKTIGEMLAKSGCTGPRIARVDPPVTNPPVGNGSAAAGSGGDQGSATTPPPNDEHHQQAEALNAQGGDKLRGADVPGALADFQQALALYPDPRYQYNICLALEAQEQWGNAIAACQKAKAMNPDDRLSGKIDHRIDLLKQHTAK